MTDSERTMLGDAMPNAIRALVDALSATRLEGWGDSYSSVPDHERRIKAANSLLDRRYGKAPQAITGEDGGPLQVANYDLTQLTDAQFAAFVALRDAMKAAK
jgi:hypothetical protein